MAYPAMIHRIGPRHSSNWNTCAEIAHWNMITPRYIPLTIDGVYSEVYDQRIFLGSLKRPIILFPSWKHVGGDNSFDPCKTELPGTFCTMAQIMDLRNRFGFEIGHHSHSHLDMTKLNDRELWDELSTPVDRVTKFAYPFGKHDARVRDAVAAHGFEIAFSVHEGDDSPFQLRRSYINW